MPARGAVRRRGPGRPEGSWRACPLRSAGWLVLALTAAGPAAADAIEAVSVEVLQRDSRWAEWRAGGSALLQERGRLVGLRVGALLATWPSGAGAPACLHLDLEHLRGARDYEGVNSRGGSEHTRVDVTEQALRLRLAQPLADAWTLEAALQPTRIDRHLRGTATAIGYPERWTWVDAEAGVARQGRRADGRWQLRLAGVAVLGARNRVRLTGDEPVVLQPRAGRAVRLSATWAAPLALGDAQGPRWHWRAGLDWQRRRFEASREVPLSAGGSGAGGLYQPRTGMDGMSLSFGLHRSLP